MGQQEPVFVTGAVRVAIAALLNGHVVGDHRSERDSSRALSAFGLYRILASRHHTASLVNLGSGLG
jgi:hypothetical protein